MDRNGFVKILSLYLAISVTILSMPNNGWAMFLSSDDATTVRAADLSKVRAVLESRVVSQRLQDIGLSTDEAMKRLSSLSDEQIHELATNINALEAGGDAVGSLIFLLLVAIVVVVVLQATGHQVIIKR